MEAKQGKMIAAGVLPICISTDRILLGKRKANTEYGGTWASWGGKFEEGKGDLTMEDCARREFWEESVIDVDYHFVEEPVHVYEDHRVIYHTYVGFFKEEVDPNIHTNGELVDYDWFHIDDLPSPLMPEFQVMLDIELPKIKELMLKMKSKNDEGK